MNKIIKAPRESGVCQVPVEKKILVEPLVQGEDETEEEPSPPEIDTTQLVEEARQEAAAIISKAKGEAKSLQENACKEGFKKGKEEGMVAAKKAEEKMLKEAREVMDETVKLRGMLLKAAEPQVVELALQVAEAVIQKKLETEKNLIVDIVAEALALVSGEEKITVKMNPTDLTVCRKYKDFFQDLITKGAEFRLISDDNVPRGSCLVFTRDNIVESFLEERFKSLKEALLKEAYYVNADPQDESG